MRWSCVLFGLCFALLGCPESRPRGGTDAGRGADAEVAIDAGALDATARDGDVTDGGQPDADPVDTGARDAETLDATRADSGASDAGPADSGVVDGGPVDVGPPDTGAVDAGPPDTGVIDAGPPDSGVVDAGPPDTGAPPPVTCNEPGLVTEVITDSASSGTPDSYFRDVTPGDPLCASIVGGGSGTWGVVVSNGTSSGIYCNNVPNCRIRVSPGDTTLIITAVTSDIGGYTLTIRRIPP